MESFNKQICRTCMVEAKEEQALHFIYDSPTEKSNRSIADLLSATMPRLVIEPEDKLPKNICMRCLDTLLTLNNFQELCYLSQCELLQMLDTRAEAQTPPIDTVVDEIMPLPDPLEFELKMLEDIDPLQKNDCLIKEQEDDDEENMEERLRSNGKEEQTAGKITTTNLATIDKSTRTRTRRSNKAQSKYNPKSHFPTESIQNVNNLDMCNKNEELPDIPKKTRKKRPKKQISVEEQDTATDPTTTKPRRKHTSKDLKHVCEYCNKGFHQSSSLRDHVRVHTGEQPYLCSECGKAFTSNSNMKQHLLRHTGERRYECPECPKKFPCLSDLSSHKAMHAKIKPHICDLCGAAFGKLSQLKKHNMYHNGEKPHKCEYCEMRFVCADHARRHQRTHTGEKPYKCKYCIRAFAQSNDLIKHLRTHLGENVYRCELCPKGFRLASELRVHFSSHKNDDEATRLKNLTALQEEEAKLKATLIMCRNIEGVAESTMDGISAAKI